MADPEDPAPPDGEPPPDDEPPPDGELPPDDEPPPDGDLPPDGEPPPGGDGELRTRAGDLGRQMGLGLVAFVATLALLVGFGALLATRSPGGGATASPIRPSGSSGLGSGLAPSASPIAGASVPGDPVLVGAGDIADCELDGDEATAALLDTIAGTVFTAGDHAYDSGTSQEFGECYAPSWGRHRARTLPAAGNHDWATEDAAGYRSYFGDAVGAEGATWYSTDLGTWHVIVLDSNCAKVEGCGPDSPQGRWLAADLSASEARCTAAIWHHPRFSSGEHGSDPLTDPFWRALHAAGVDIVVNGHDHDYERFAPQDPEGVEDREGGIRQFVVGTGGAPIRPFATVAANSELRVAHSHGVLQLTLRDGSYDWRWQPVPGLSFSDVGTAFCH